jgi:tRNA 2-selenouridine synthase
LHGREKIARWQAMAESGQLEALVEELLIDHYDPAYLRSIDRNFSQFSQARSLELAALDDEAFGQAAQRLQDEA